MKNFAAGALAAIAFIALDWYVRRQLDRKFGAA